MISIIIPKNGQTKTDTLTNREINQRDFFVEWMKQQENPLFCVCAGLKKRQSVWYNVVLLHCMKLAHCTWMIRTSNPTISCVIYKYQGERVYKPFQLILLSWLAGWVVWSSAATIALLAGSGWQCRVFWIVKRKTTKASTQFFF